MFNSEPSPSTFHASLENIPASRESPICATPIPISIQQRSLPTDDHESDDKTEILYETSEIKAHDRHQTIVHIHDRFLMRKDNLVCLVSQDGMPIDPDAVDLIKRKKTTIHI